MKKVAVIFGGRSGEHEVSLVSAGSVIAALDPAKYEVLEIGITHDGQWLRGAGCLDKFKKGEFEGLEKMSLSTEPGAQDFDIAFPVLHGPFGEDGTVQGLFEMLDVPYVGCGVLASSTAMDKLQCKAILAQGGVPVVDYIGFNRGEEMVEEILEKIGLPCFVKPANMGSSVGISKAKDEDGLRVAIAEAAKYDSRILVEKAVNAREIECAVLGNENPEAGPLGEVLVGGEFYDYNDKYVNGVSKTQIPAALDESVSEGIKAMCIKAYKLLDCSGLARVDCFLDRDSGDIFLNELNTMPGFTSISMYPKMIEASGLSYPQLVDRLIDLGLERYHDRKRNLVRFDSGSDWYK